MPKGVYKRTKSAWNKGKHLSEEHRATLGASISKTFFRKKAEGKIHYKEVEKKVRKKHPPPTKQACVAGGKAMKGRTGERNNKYGHVTSEAARQKMRDKRRKFIDDMSEEEYAAFFSRFSLAGIAANQLLRPSKPEQALADAFTKRALVFEQQYKIEWCCVDFYFPEKNMVVEFFGCYWHQCELCGFHQGTPNGVAKTVRGKNVRKIKYLQKLGYTVLVIWEHELESALAKIGEAQ